MDALDVDRSGREELNFQLLQKRDSNIIEILNTSSHVVLYEFDTVETEWVLEYGIY